jgi:hypothetical protein
MNYEKKYFKYKIKYLELKKQIGGVLNCTFFIKSVKNAKEAILNNCPPAVIAEFDKKTLTAAGYYDDDDDLPADYYDDD